MIDFLNNLDEKAKSLLQSPANACLFPLDEEGSRKGDGHFEFMFNPSEYTETFNTEWDDPEEGRKVPTFKGFNRDKLSLEVIFDSYQTPKGPQDVRIDRESMLNGSLASVASQWANGGTKTIYGVSSLIKLLEPEENPLNSQNKVPPLLEFVWGDISYKGRIESLEVKYTMFTRDGTPVRAKVNLSMLPFDNNADLMKNMGLEACRKVRTIEQGARLDLLAYKELKDSNQWKEIARENDIKDPLAFPLGDEIGKTIILPDVKNS